jgi:hypothetical protein
MAVFYTDSGSFNDLKVTGSIFISASRGIALQVRSSGSTIFSVSGSAGEIFNISDAGSSTSLFIISSGSTNILNVDSTKAVSVSGSLVVTGSAYISNNVAIGTTADSGHKLYISGSDISGSLNVNNVMFVSSSNVTITGSLRVSAGITGSLQGTASFATTASHALNANLGYKQLLYVFSQIGSDAPSVPSNPSTPVFDKYIINTTGRTFTFTRISAGIYHLIASDTASFLVGRTAIYLTPGHATGSSDFACSYEWGNEGKIVIYSTLKNGTLSDSLFSNTTLDIRIY